MAVNSKAFASLRMTNSYKEQKFRQRLTDFQNDLAVILAFLQ
jgi:hypothetical protein